MKYEELLQLNNKISFLLGLASGSLSLILSSETLTDTSLLKLSALFQKLNDGINDIYYTKSKQCEHVSDGVCYTSNPEKRKCTKCQDYY